MNFSSQEEYDQHQGDMATAEMENNQDAAYAEHLEQLNQLPAMPATSLLAVFETSEAQRNSFADSLMEAIDNGSADAVKVLVGLKAMVATADILLDKSEKTNKRSDVAKLFNNYVLDAAATYEKDGKDKSFNAFGAKLKQTEVGSRWDYSQCNSAELLRLEAEALKATEALKEHQKYLQNLPSAGIEILDTESGEMVKVYKPSKSSTTALTVSLK